MRRKKIVNKGQGRSQPHSHRRPCINDLLRRLHNDGCGENECVLTTLRLVWQWRGRRQSETCNRCKAVRKSNVTSLFLDVKIFSQKPPNVKLCDGVEVPYITIVILYDVSKQTREKTTVDSNGSAGSPAAIMSPCLLLSFLIFLLVPKVSPFL